MRPQGVLKDSFFKKHLHVSTSFPKKDFPKELRGMTKLDWIKVYDEFWSFLIELESLGLELGFLSLRDLELN